MRRRTAIAVLIGALALGGSAQAVTLVTPSGEPVGGKWQRWADQARVPTYRGPVIFTADTSTFCGANIPGCSTPAPWDNYSHPYELAAIDRDSLYFELGHIFDWAYLSWPSRQRLAVGIWRLRW